jgi:hypothetical protein
MRIQELLLEYNRQITLQKIGDQLTQTAAREHTTAEEAIAALEEMDPTANKQYTPWLARQYIKQQFRLEDADRIRTVLDNFGQLKSRLPVEQRDIGRMDFYQLDDLINQVLDVKLEVDKPIEGGTFPIVPDSRVLYNGPLGQLAIPETREASCELGRGTEWCTAYTKSNNQFDSYNRRGPLYVWRDKNGEKYQFHFSGGLQMMDSRDRPIEKDKIDYFRKQHPVLKKLFRQIESQALKDPILATQYAEKVIGGRWPEGEATIAQTSQAAYYYARKIIKSRFPEGEAALLEPSTDINFLIFYAEQVIKGRWPEAEEMIAQNPSAAFYYARHIIKGPFPEGEDAIAQDDRLAYNYAVEILKDRFLKGEKTLQKSNVYWYHYKKHFGIKQRKGKT